MQLLKLAGRDTKIFYEVFNLNDKITNTRTIGFGGQKKNKSVNVPGLTYNEEEEMLINQKPDGVTT
jgi:hypothetical protein